MLLTNVFCCGFTFRPARPGLMLQMDYLGRHFDFVHLAVEMFRRKSTTDISSSLTEHSTHCVCPGICLPKCIHIFYVPKRKTPYKSYEIKSFLKMS